MRNLANKSSGGFCSETEGTEVGGGLTAAPGLGVSQAAHLVASAPLEIMQTSQDQPEDFCRNLAKISSTGAVPLTFSSWGGGGSDPVLSSSALVSSLVTEPNTGADEDPLLAGAERKAKASEAETELVEEKPPKLLKMFFF